MLIFVNRLTKQTIGQAYEEMQTQNSRLLQQITERDDYNTQVFLLAIVHFAEPADIFR